MTFPKVFVTRKIADKAIALLQDACEVEIWLEKYPPPYALLEEKVQSVTGILTLLTDKIDQSLISKCQPSFKVISQMAVGYDNIDVKAASMRKIPIGHTPGVLTETTADFTFALLLSSARRVVEAHNQVQNGIWEPWGPDILTGQEVSGSTLGIIGFGRIGQAVARRAAGFNMRILYYDKEEKRDVAQQVRAEFTPLEELVSKSDFISLHVNLSEQTHRLINRKLLEMMKPSAIIINTSRGGVIDSDDLIWALSNKKIFGAALDVFSIEPIPNEHPLLSMDNVIITPHIASASVQTREKMAIIAAQNLLAGVSGQRLPYCVNPDVYS